MLTISPARRALEAARAAEIQVAEQAMVRGRILWYIAAFGCVLGGAGTASIGFHLTSVKSGMVWLWAGVLIGEIGPLAILVYVLDREQR